MIKVCALNEVSENQQIIRVVKEKDLFRTIGKIDEKLISSFPINLQSAYRMIEDRSRKDLGEGKTKINLGNTAPGTCHVGNEALISCWTLLNQQTNIFDMLTNSKFKKEKENVYVIVSTVGKVKAVFESLVNVIHSIKYYDDVSLVSNAVFGVVQYYCPHGINLLDWKEKANNRFGVDMPIIQGIFHKESAFEDENELRFSIILNLFRYFGNQDYNCGIDSKHFIKPFIYPELIRLDIVPKIATISNYIRNL